MIGIFPDPHPDEIFYSICARLCERAGYSNNRIAMQDIFGCESVVASIVLPSHLDDFVSRLPPETRYTSDYLITEHTSLPFYSPFLPAKRLNHLQQDICGRNGPGLHMRSGIMASLVPLPEWLRYCPQCVMEDKKHVGECYWHRVHQVPGVEICPLHKMLLQNSCVRARNKQTRHEYVPAQRVLQNSEPDPSDSRSLYHGILLNIAQDAYWLLRQHQRNQDLRSLQMRYRKLLSKVNLATYRGRVDVSMFTQMFKEHYPSQLLHLLHCELEEGVQETWLLRLVRTPDGAQHPLHHLLLMHFLGYTAKDFFNLSAEIKPFGNGPWPCLNPTCHYYRQAFIKECQIEYSQYASGRPVATFSCVCGFSYSRVGPDKTEADLFSRCRINAFGATWETRLQELWRDGTASLRAIARQLAVDPLTIKRQAARIGLPFPRPVGRCLRPRVFQKTPSIQGQAPENATLEMKRTLWLTIMQAYPEAGVKMLRSKEPGLYTWLYRNDKMWLQAHTPLRKKSEQKFRRVDWEKRDQQLAEEAKAVMFRLKYLPGRPVRITVSAIGREIGQLALLQQHLDKLPRTADILRDLIETREAFAIRKVWWAMRTFSQKHICPERWLLIRKAGIARLAMHPLVKNAIDTALQSLQQNTW